MSLPDYALTDTSGVHSGFEREFDLCSKSSSHSSVRVVPFGWRCGYRIEAGLDREPSIGESLYALCAVESVGARRTLWASSPLGRNYQPVRAERRVI
jgi:hypothetical protein